MGECHFLAMAAKGSSYTPLEIAKHIRIPRADTTIRELQPIE